MVTAVYNLKYDERNKAYGLEIDKPHFKTPSKLYGKLPHRAKHFWNTFSRTAASLGVMLTGEPGSGKTELGNVLSNFALQFHMPVIYIKNVKTTLDLLSFLEQLPECVLYMDEYAKNFDYYLQEKMLSFMSNKEMSRKLFIVTENNKRNISKFINNRPGRLFYHVDFGRLEEDVFEEYCKDFKYVPSFLKQLRDKYEESSTFSFDHLHAITTEHLMYPEQDFKETLDILNVSVLVKPTILIVNNVLDESKDGDDQKVDFLDANVQQDQFDRGRRLWVRLKGHDQPGFDVEKKDVIKVTDDRLTCFVGNKFKVELDIIK